MELQHNHTATVTFATKFNNCMFQRILSVVLVGSLFFLACNPNNTTVDSGLQKYFDEQKVEGCFALWDNAQNHFTIYNLKRYRDSAYQPASTFKIVNSLIGLRTGRVFSDTVVIPWDKKVHFYPNGDTAKAWMADLNMRQAFEASAVPYYQELARRIGKDTMKFYLDTIKYGNRLMGGAIDTFWLNNTLKVTADEQLGLVKRIYFKQMPAPFQAREQEIVRSMMIRETNANYILAYKTGWGVLENGHQLGWIIGWIEENRHVYFFSMNIESPDKKIDMGKVRMDILKGILKEKGFFEGRM